MAKSSFLEDSLSWLPRASLTPPLAFLPPLLTFTQEELRLHGL